MLFNWADYIVVVQAEYVEKIPAVFRSKVLIVEIGHDDWGPRWHAELKRRAYIGLEQLPEGVL